MPKSNDKIINALEQLIKERGWSKREAAKQMGVTNRSLLVWLDGGGISERVYQKRVYPLIKKFLEPTEPEKRIPDQLQEPYNNLKTIFQGDKKQFWIVEQFLRNTASVVKESGKTEPIEYPKTDATVKFEVAESSLPYLRQQVAAGNGMEIIEERFKNRPDMHFMDVYGESMEPNYQHGQKILVQLFQERVTFGENHIPMEVVKAMIPENTIILYSRNDEGLAMKRVKYEKGSGKDSWYLKLTADNEEWAKENKFRRIIRKTDDFVIYGKVLS